MIIRQVRPTEGAALRAIRLEALGESPAAFSSTYVETAARPPEYWDARARGIAGDQESTIFVAEDTGGWVGMVGVVLEESADTRSAELISMWIDPAYRRSSVGPGSATPPWVTTSSPTDDRLGQGLVEHVVEWARQRGANAVWLRVMENNSRAVSLYTRCGFRSTPDIEPLPSDRTLLAQRMVLEL